MTIIEIPVTHTIDLRQLPPWLVERQLSRTMPHLRRSDVIEVWTTDASTSSVVEAWATAAGHRLIGIETRDGYHEVSVKVTR